MDLNRNHYFMLGLVVLFLGIQVKFVETYTLTEDAARFVDKNFRKGQRAQTDAPVAGAIQSAAASTAVPASRRSFQPPQAGSGASG